MENRVSPGDEYIAANLGVCWIRRVNGRICGTAV